MSSNTQLFPETTRKSQLIKASDQMLNEIQMQTKIVASTKEEIYYAIKFYKLFNPIGLKFNENVINLISSNADHEKDKTTFTFNTEYFPNSCPLSSFLENPPKWSEESIQKIVRQIVNGLFSIQNSFKSLNWFDLTPDSILIKQKTWEIKWWSIPTNKILNPNSKEILKTDYLYYSPEYWEYVCDKEKTVNKTNNNLTNFWAWGIIVYQMIYGETPFQENNLRDVWKR